MKLYLLRHTDAVQGSPDEQRPLSPTGEKQAQNIGRFLHAAGVSLDLIYSSPLLRARQTAEIVAKAIGQKDSRAQFELTEALRNETRWPEFVEWIEQLPQAKAVLLVGHNPSLSDRARRFLHVSGDDETLDLPKGGLVCLKRSPHLPAQLKLLITPSYL